MENNFEKKREDSLLESIYAKGWYGYYLDSICERERVETQLKSLIEC